MDNTMNLADTLFRFVGVVMLLALAGCASVIRGDQQRVRVETVCGARAVPAQCTASNDRGRWSFRAPTDLVVTRDTSALQIACSSPYFGSQILQVPSGLNMGLAGNMLAGGLLGMGVDVVTGAGLSYPQQVVVNYPGCR